MEQNGRRAIVVLVRDGVLLGSLPPIDLELPWWPEVAQLVVAVRERYGMEITVLRLLRGISEHVWGGEVAYLAETRESRVDVELDRWSGDPLLEEPLRQLWARPEGVGELLSWADAQLALAGLNRTGPVAQMRTWNLSALWKIPTARGWVWLKAVPGFFAHEGAVIDWIGPPVAPEMFGYDRGRVLLADVGAANHETRAATSLRSMVQLLTGLQERALSRLDELAAIGVPDRRLASMEPRIASVVQTHAGALDRADRRTLDGLVAGLAARLAAIEDCGIPDTLVHGDYHSGNVAGAPGSYVILDWGDSFVGHPLIDELAFTERLDEAARSAAREWFIGDWQRIVPGSDPGRAADLLEPLLPLLAAVMYAGFCAEIEPDERIYHASDVPRSLRQAAGEQ